jgi:hypothetical protein
MGCLRHEEHLTHRSGSASDLEFFSALGGSKAMAAHLGIAIRERKRTEFLRKYEFVP